MLMYLFFLIFTGLISESIQSEKPIREYVVKKDMVAGFKAGQFSIYSDQDEKNLKYRIESYYSPMQKIELQTYPQKKVIGKLNAHQLGTWYEAIIEILDTRNMSNTWFTGHIKRSFAWFSDKYTVHLAERTILMKSKVVSRTFRFFNERNKLLALYKMRFFVASGVTKYDLKIFSNEFPDTVYILALAAHDHKRAKVFGNVNGNDSGE